MTDANGYYHFDGLAAGTYAVVEVHPDGYIDGTTRRARWAACGESGSAIPAERADPVKSLPTGSISLIERIPRASLATTRSCGFRSRPGSTRRENNFSEVRDAAARSRSPPEDGRRRPAAGVRGAELLRSRPLLYVLAAAADAHARSGSAARRRRWATRGT